MRVLKHIVVVSVIVSCLPLLAQNVPSYPIGESWQFGDARQLGLAGAGSVSNGSVAALVGNPAAMGRAAMGLHVQVDAGMRSLEERRAFPMFDRFDDFSTEGIYAQNNNWFSGLQGGIQYNFSNRFLKSLAVGIHNELDQDYQYQEEVRENVFGDALLAYNTIEVNGGLTRYSLGSAVRVFDKLDAGVSLGMLKGDLSQRQAVIFVNDPEDDLEAVESFEVDGAPVVVGLGLTYQATAHVALGSHLRLPYSVDYQNLSQDADARDLTVEYPMQLTAGLEYRGRQPLRARLNIDFSYEWWSQTDLGGIVLQDQVGSKLDDAAIVKIGVEHLIADEVPLLVGVQYRSTFQNRQDNRLLVSAGTGFKGDGWVVNVSGAFSKYTYSAFDLFDDALYGGDRSGSPVDEVDERYFFGMLTLSVDL